ncbi:MAG: hypothetical protein HQ481_15455 [Alphaproteobacteria bacterium]|nr:hypothetical protein [Alphaproteobacteria bacterium]
MDGINQAEAAYPRARGIEVLGLYGLGLEKDSDMVRVAPDFITDHAAAAAHRHLDAEAVFISCGAPESTIRSRVSAACCASTKHNRGHRLDGLLNHASRGQAGDGHADQIGNEAKRRLAHHADRCGVGDLREAWRDDGHRSGEI